MLFFLSSLFLLDSALKVRLQQVKSSAYLSLQEQLAWSSVSGGMWSRAVGEQEL